MHFRSWSLPVGTAPWELLKAPAPGCQPFGTIIVRNYHPLSDIVLLSNTHNICILAMAFHQFYMLSNDDTSSSTVRLCLLLDSYVLWCPAIVSVLICCPTITSSVQQLHRSATQQLYNNVAWHFYQLYLLSNNYICCSTVKSAVWQLYTLSCNFSVSYTCCPTITHLLYNSCIYCLTIIYIHTCFPTIPSVITAVQHLHLVFNHSSFGYIIHSLWMDNNMQ